MEFYTSTTNSQGVITCLFTLRKHFLNMVLTGIDKSLCVCVAQRSVRLVYSVKLHRSPTQNA